jgi:hypothetical protein
LKTPAAERLRLEYHEVLSSFAFNFNVRRYNMAGDRLVSSVLSAGADTRALFGSASAHSVG